MSTSLLGRWSWAIPASPSIFPWDSLQPSGGAISQRDGPSRVASWLPLPGGGSEIVYILHAGREAGLLSRLGALPHSFGVGPPCLRAPRRGRGPRWRGSFPGKRTGAGACGSSPRALGSLGPSDPKAVGRGCPITRSGPAEGSSLPRILRKEESCLRAGSLLTRAAAPISFKISGDSGGRQIEVGKANERSGEAPTRRGRGREPRGRPGGVPASPVPAEDVELSAPLSSGGASWPRKFAGGEAESQVAVGIPLDAGRRAPEDGPWGRSRSHPWATWRAEL